MITRTVKLRSIRGQRRLDSKYFLSPGRQAAERVEAASAAGVELRLIGGPNGLAKLSVPQRFKRSYAAPGEPGAPYLRPYDIFDYIPQAADLLSLRRSDNIGELTASVGTILQTCSGRNLGPAVEVDRYLGSFVLSHDLIRVSTDDPVDRRYLLAFLLTPTGQALVRRDKTGSVIDHISIDHLANVAVPFFDKSMRLRVSRDFSKALTLREEARLVLAGAVKDLEATLPSREPRKPRKAGWDVRARALGTRLDAAFHDPTPARMRKALRRAGGPSLAEVADIVKPAGRYKTYYVDSAYGRPILSGRQVLQYAPINLQYISPRSLDPSRYQLHHPHLAFPADGRAEERLGVPVIIEPHRSGWLASGHVARILPKKGVDPGWLWTAFAATQVQLQLKTLACGSVVDAIYPEDAESVVLPPPDNVDRHHILDAWGKFSQASALEARAVTAVEDELARITGEAQVST